jgi:hypothetical protein
VIRNWTVQYFPLWYNDLKSKVGDNFSNVLKQGYCQAKGKCQLCSIHKPSKLYPLWTIDHESKQFILNRFIMLCDECNSMLYISTYSDSREAVACYFRGILKQSEEEVLKQLDKAYEEYIVTRNYTFNFDKLWYHIETPQSKALNKFKF